MLKGWGYGFNIWICGGHGSVYGSRGQRRGLSSDLGATTAQLQGMAPQVRLYKVVGFIMVKS